MTSGTIRARDVISSHARARVREERRSSDADARIDREEANGTTRRAMVKTSASGDDGLVTEMFFWINRDSTVGRCAVQWDEDLVR